MTRSFRFLAVAAVVVSGACSGGWHPDVEESPLVEARPGAELAMHVDEEAGELVLELPPVDIPAHGADAGHGHAGHVTDALIGRVPVTGWLRGFRTELVDAHGDTVPSVLLHHMNLMTPDRRELFSPIMQRVAAAGHETAPVELPRMLGYPVAAGERLLLKAMVHNPTGTDYHGVRVRVRMPFTPGDAKLAPMHVFPFYLDVMPPAGIHAYDLPPGRSEQSWEGRPAVEARILALGGHLHKYAEVLRLEDVTVGKVLWETKPNVDDDGNVIGMPQDYLIKRLGIRLDPSHTYRLTAIYNNPTGEVIPEGAMGAAGGIVLVDRDAPWPGVDAADPQYALDVATQVEGKDAGMMNVNHEPAAGGATSHESHGEATPAGTLPEAAHQH
ncbi:MAG TPA: hypothetical protein VFU06_00775 [Longimicrobiales bacterium]|nr:hypothetical protein [Longimicrobiales bacterium]